MSITQQHEITDLRDNMKTACDTASVFFMEGLQWDPNAVLTDKGRTMLWIPPTTEHTDPNNGRAEHEFTCILYDVLHEDQKTESEPLNQSFYADSYRSLERDFYEIVSDFIELGDPASGGTGGYVYSDKITLDRLRDQLNDKLLAVQGIFKVTTDWYCDTSL